MGLYPFLGPLGFSLVGTKEKKIENLKWLVICKNIGGHQCENSGKKIRDGKYRGQGVFLPIYCKFSNFIMIF